MTMQPTKCLYLTLNVISLFILGISHWYDDDDDSEYEIFTKRSIRAASTTKQTENPFAGRNNMSDFSWLDDALKDIAYYLRAHKFNEYDRRYQKDPATAPREYFEMFPKPPLRSLHWEVHKFCDTSFLMCVEYLNRKLKQAGMRRTDDTTVVIQEQRWNETVNAVQIAVVQSECEKMLQIDDGRADPFEGPLERFQWRTTASYYMCWYTMNEVPELRELGESCDNFAYCLDAQFGVHNHDPRATDNDQFACAVYSFCPDVCCPIKHLSNMEECWNSNKNPCYSVSPAENRACSFNRSQNTEFADILLNRWNVTCKCPHGGYEWDSKYGMCVDEDECVKQMHACNPGSEACVNLQGSFRCACRWGYVWNSPNGPCEPSPALEIIQLHNVKSVTEKPENVASSLVKRLFKKLFSKSSSSCGVMLLPSLIIVATGFSNGL